MISGVRGQEARQAQLTFAMARHALVDLAQIFSQRPVDDAPDRLPPERYQKMFELLCEGSARLCRDEFSQERLREMRALYEGYAEALSRFLRMPLPPWLTDQPHKDNWMTVARVRARAEEADVDAVGRKPDEAQTMPLIDRHHDF